MSRIRI
jgi:hypothetical protein